jgi:uncharacterized integral membrane protein (TIGR00697 family)
MGLLKLEAEQKVQILLGVFIGAIVTANLMGTKIADFGLFAASVGIFMYPITFLVTDIVAEVHGKGRLKGFIVAGFLVNVMLFLMIMLSVWLPPASRYASNEAFLEVFNPSLRIVAASLVAFLIAQIHDIMSFEFMKKKTRGRFLWLRNNASTIVSQFLDTTIFMFIAFYMVTPKYTADFIFMLIIPYWLVKVGVALLDTPFVYLGVWWLKGKRE